MVRSEQVVCRRWEFEPQEGWGLELDEVEPQVHGRLLSGKELREPWSRCGGLRGADECQSRANAPRELCAAPAQTWPVPAQPPRPRAPRPRAAPTATRTLDPRPTPAHSPRLCTLEAHIKQSCTGTLLSSPVAPEG